MKTATIELHTPVLFEKGIEIPPSAGTLAGFRAWTKSEDFPEKGRFSYLAGKLYIDLTMEELENHNKIKVEINRVVAALTVAHDSGEFYTDGVYFVNEEADVSNEPDSLFVSWATFESGKVKLIPRPDHDDQYVEIVGSPDWALEIVSDSSVKKDKKTMRELYHRAKVSEYWLIDARKEEIDFQILLYSENGYFAAAKKNGWQKSRVFSRSFRLIRQRGRMGLWRYRLEVKD